MGEPTSSEAPPGAPASPQGPLPAGPPQDADDTRGKHLGALYRHPLTISLALTGAITGFVVGTLVWGAPIGGAIAAGILLLAALIVWLMASSRAKEDFLRAYAEARGLAREGRGPLPPATPLLRRGDDHYATERMRGALPGGETGTLAHYTYEEESRDSKGNKQTTYYHFTVVICEIPECAVRVGELYCQRRFGFRFLDGFEDAFRTKQRVEFESEHMDRRFETFADDDADPNWLRQLFEPSFIVYLAESAPESLAFELVAGLLCVNVKGHSDSSAELDALCEAAATVVRRLREESAEQPVGAPSPPV